VGCWDIKEIKPMKHKIPTTRLEAFYSKISQINKKLARRKLPPIDLKVIGSITKTELLDKRVSGSKLRSKSK